VVERSGEVGRGVGEGAVEIEGDDVEWEGGHGEALSPSPYGNGKLYVRLARR